PGIRRRDGRVRPVRPGHAASEQRGRAEGVRRAEAHVESGFVRVGIHTEHSGRSRHRDGDMPLTGQPVRTLSLAIVAASSAALLLAMPRPALAQTPQDPPPAAAPRALPLLTTADLVAQ